MKVPLFTIVTITRNSAATLAETLQSIYTQTFEDFEHLIVDGMSVDNTLEIIKSFKDPRTRIVQCEPQGISNAMNRGIKESRGTWIGILHSDDLYRRNALELSLRALTDAGKRWSYGQVEYISFEGKHLYNAGKPFCMKDLKKFMVVTHPTVFVHRDLYNEVGLFDENLRLAMDYDLSLRLARLEEPAYIEEIIAQMRLGGESSKSMKAEFKTALEVFLVKTKFYPREFFSNGKYYIWTILKIFFRKSLIALGGEKIVKKFRKIINPSWISASNEGQNNLQ